MKFSPNKLNLFLLMKIPSAYFSGVRLESISDKKVVVRVRKRWINQNPFKSLYWATQGMASELTTGILVMKEIASSDQEISMLVTQQRGVFMKKAIGKITFSCMGSRNIKTAIQKAVSSGEGQKLLLISEGFDEAGDKVSTFEYEWSLKLKRKAY